MSEQVAHVPGNDLAVGKLYCAEAFAALDRALGSMAKNHDKTIESVADRLTGLG